MYNLSVEKIFLSVVIPCFDEMANLQKGVLDHVKSYLDRQRYTYEVIIVDDGSKDGSVEFIKHFVKDNTKTFRFIENKHLGKAGAVTAGVLEAKGEYTLFTDMDQATPIEEVEKLMVEFKKGSDIVIGSRNTERKNSPWTRQIMSRVWIMLRTYLVGLKGITDTQCGFKMFTKEAGKEIFSAIKTIHNGFSPVDGSSVTAGFDVELLYIAQRKGYTIKEVPVKWLYVETRRVNPLKDSIEGLQDLFRIKQRDSQGFYSQKRT